MLVLLINIKKYWRYDPTLLKFWGSARSSPDAKQSRRRVSPRGADLKTEPVLLEAIDKREISYNLLVGQASLQDMPGVRGRYELRRESQISSFYAKD